MSAMAKVSNITSAFRVCCIHALWRRMEHETIDEQNDAHHFSRGHLQANGWTNCTAIEQEVVRAIVMR